MTLLSWLVLIWQLKRLLVIWPKFTRSTMFSSPLNNHPDLREFVLSGVRVAPLTADLGEGPFGTVKEVSKEDKWLYGEKRLLTSVKEIEREFTIIIIMHPQGVLIWWNNSGIVECACLIWENMCLAPHGSQLPCLNSHTPLVYNTKTIYGAMAAKGSADYTLLSTQTVKHILTWTQVLKL